MSGVEGKISDSDGNRFLASSNIVVQVSFLFGCELKK